MTYIIGSPCISVCDTACVEVCPVDCIYAPVPLEEIYSIQDQSGIAPATTIPALEGLQLYIHPDECIDCAACEPECPVDAIRAEGASHPEFDVKEYLAINSQFFEGDHDAYNLAGKL